MCYPWLGIRLGPISDKFVVWLHSSKGFWGIYIETPEWQHRSLVFINLIGRDYSLSACLVVSCWGSSDQTHAIYYWKHSRVTQTNVKQNVLIAPKHTCTLTWMRVIIGKYKLYKKKHNILDGDWLNDSNATFVYF